MPRTFEDSPEFARLVAGDDAADLVRIALEIARDAEPGLEFGPYLARIDALADRVRPRIGPGASIEDVLHQINWALYVEEGFSGNEDAYDDPRNSYLNAVIDRGTGIPITLGVLYRAVAGRLRLPLAGVNLPVHFVLRADREDGSTVFIDPFHGGALLDRDGCRRLIAARSGGAVVPADEQFRAVSTAEVVARMLRNLKVIFLRGGDAASALPVLERLAALRPGDPVHRRDLGIALVGLDRPGEAIGQFSAYLEQAARPEDAAEIRELILELRRRAAEGDGPAAE